jgi:hypothetical protein
VRKENAIASGGNGIAAGTTHDFKFRNGDPLSSCMKFSKPGKLFPYFFRLVKGRADAGLDKKLPKLFDDLFVAYAAVMRMMQNAFDIVQDHSKTRAMAWLDGASQVMKQGFDLAPVDVAAHWILKYGS